MGLVNGFADGILMVAHYFAIDGVVVSAVVGP
jgi:hypothetical protein